MILESYILHLTRSISQQITQSVSEFSQIAQETSQASEVLNDNSNSLASVATRLVNTIDFFKIDKLQEQVKTGSKKRKITNNKLTDNVKNVVEPDEKKLTYVKQE